MKIRIMITLFILVLCSPALVALDTCTLKVDFSGKNRDKVYDVHTTLDYTTTVILPEGMTSRHVVCGDLDRWKLETDGNFIFIKPLRRSIQTSLTIVTLCHRVFVLNMVERSRMVQNYKVAARVVIISDRAVKKKQPAESLTEPPVVPLKPQAKLYTRYSIKDDRYGLEKVYDDGIFTYLYMPTAQVKPAIFLKRGRRLEPVRYVDRGDIVVIHDVLSKREKFVLILDKLKTQIKRR